jgi:hypothetical protein
MEAETIRNLRSAEPFKPFRLIMRDGRDLPVERAAYLAISPTGRAVAYAREIGGFEFLSLADIADVVVDEKMQTVWRRAL